MVIKQMGLRGVWTNRRDCPHIVRGDVDKCEIGHMAPCAYETGNTCEIMREIIHDWTLACGICPDCGSNLESFSGLENIPAYQFCPKCNNKAYNDAGKEIARLE